ncbi:hypothetical protein L917_15833, partial [Phytophthora nicotianae]
LLSRFSTFYHIRLEDAHPSFDNTTRPSVSCCASTWDPWRAKLLNPKFCPVSRMNVVSDSAFPCSTELTGRILTPLKDGDIDRILPSLRSGLCTLHNAITSVRQSIEWDMGSMQQPPQSPAPYHPELRGLRIDNNFRMSNYRVRTVVIS